MASISSITLTIRLGTTTRFTIPSNDATTISLSSTILEVKQCIALEEAADRCPVERQRLIFKGRILSDDSRTLSDYGVTAENKTLHLVKGSAPKNTGSSSGGSATTAPASNPVSTPTPAPTPTTSVPPANNPTPGIPNLMAGGQPPSLASMRQQLMENPELMGNLMNNPAIRSLMSNPDIIRSMMESNPEMRQVMDANPQLRHILDDPEMMRRSMEMMRDPSAMQNMMRNQDLAMSQIENLPGGFSALRRMYEDIQEPMMDAMAGSAAPSSDSTTSTNRSSSAGGAMPNPWGPNPASTSNSSTPNPASSTPFNPWAMPNLPTSSNNTNPAAGGAGAANPFAGGMNPPNMEQTMQMLENPLFQNMMNSLLSDPATLQQMTENNPMLQQMRTQNPAAAAMFSNPDTMREMLNPNNLRAMMQIQQGMQSLQGSGLMNNLPGMPPMPSGASGSTGGTDTASNNLDFSQLLTQLQNTSMSSPAPPSNIPPEERYRVSLQSLMDMGFTNSEQNLRVIQQAHGNVNRAVDLILAEPVPPSSSEGSSDNTDGEQQS